MAKKTKKKYSWRKGSKRPKGKRFGVMSGTEPGSFNLIQPTGVIVADVDEYGQVHPPLARSFEDTKKNMRRARKYL